MRLQVKGKHVAVDPAIREYAEAKFAHLEPQLPGEIEVELEISEEHSSTPLTHVAEATVFTKGPALRARVVSNSDRLSIDRIVDKLDRQVTRYREKRRIEPRRHVPHHNA